MKFAIASLKSGSQGKEVKNLNNCLVFLLDKTSAIIDIKPINLAPGVSPLNELINQDLEQYGPVTESLILLFQKNQQLVETGEVNEETADKLNAVLNNIGAFDRQIPYKINGQAFNGLSEAIDKTTDTLQQVQGITSTIKKFAGDHEATSSHLLRLSIKDGEYTYAKAEDIIMIESSDHLSIVHVAQQEGKVKTTLRNSCLKDFLLDLPKNCFLRVNRFCAVNLYRLSGGSYHQQFFEFDHCIKVKPKHPLSHAIFNSIGK